MMKKVLFLLLLIAAFGVKANAQCSPCIDCVDSMRINPFQDCGPEYQPYCGCDGNWYRNSCSAFWQNGINCSAAGESCCPPLDFNLLPNLVSESLKVEVYLRLGLSGFINIRLIDSYGKLKSSSNIFFNEGSQKVPVEVDILGLRPGVYYLFVQSQGITLWEKFVKI